MSNVVKSFPVCKCNQYSCYAPIEAIFILKVNEVNENTCTYSYHMIDIFKWNDESEDEVKNNILLDTQKCVDVLQIIDVNTGIDQSVEIIEYTFNWYIRTIYEAFVRFGRYDICEKEPKRQYKTLDKPWFTEECKRLHKDYLRALSNF